MDNFGAQTVGTVPLVNTEGELAYVSLKDLHYILQWRWYKNVVGFAASTEHVPRLMHRVVVEHMHGQIPPMFQLDHADGNRLNNTRENLRLCTSAENMANIPRDKYKGSSKYKGVAWDKRPNRSKPWKAQISINDKTRHLGVYATEEEAAKAYDKAAKKLRGEFAWLNFPGEIDGAT